MVRSRLVHHRSHSLCHDSRPDTGEVSDSFVRVFSTTCIHETMGLDCDKSARMHVYNRWKYDKILKSLISNQLRDAPVFE